MNARIAAVVAGSSRRKTDIDSSGDSDDFGSFGFFGFRCGMQAIIAIPAELAE